MCVCLCVCRTWTGPAWSPAQSISSVLISIQSLMTENPYHNEPGFEQVVCVCVGGGTGLCVGAQSTFNAGSVTKIQECFPQCSEWEEFACVKDVSSDFNVETVNKLKMHLQGIFMVLNLELSMRLARHPTQQEGTWSVKERSGFQSVVRCNQCKKKSFQLGLVRSDVGLKIIYQWWPIEHKDIMQ